MSWTRWLRTSHRLSSLHLEQWYFISDFPSILTLLPLDYANQWKLLWEHLRSVPSFGSPPCSSRSRALHLRLPAPRGLSHPAAGSSPVQLSASRLSTAVLAGGKPGGWISPDDGATYQSELTSTISSVTTPWDGFTFLRSSREEIWRQLSQITSSLVLLLRIQASCF